MDQMIENQNLSDVSVTIPEIPQECLDMEMDSEMESLESYEEEQLPFMDEATIEAELSKELEDDLWQARTGLTKETLCGAIETIIFMNDKPISILKIKALIDVDIPLKVVHEAIVRLQAEYEEKHHGIRLQEVAEGYQFRTKATFSKYVQDIFKVNSLVLSPTALEVLAIIAYKQPVSKVEVEKIRGVDSSHIIRALIDKRLVKVAGRSEEVGRPVLYATTLEFLEVFNLASIKELPPEHELATMAENNVGKISDIKSILIRGDQSRFQFDELEELDQLTQSIKLISADTPFTKSLSLEEKKGATPVEGVARKSAFELLEEYLNCDLVMNQNRASVLSDLLLPGVSPKIIQDLTTGPFNLPLPEEEFSMVDVETGEIITDPTLAENEGLLYGDQESDLNRMNASLDQALQNLTTVNLEETTQEEVEVIDDCAKDIDDLTDRMIEEGSELDLNLDFLKDSNTPVNVIYQ